MLYSRLDLPQRRSKGPELAEDFEVIDGIVLRKKTVPLFEATHFQETYPKVKTEKEQRFGQHLVYRKQQARLMNAVYTHYTQPILLQILSSC